MSSPKTALIMAGGTGGHIFPGLAVAEELRARGWRVHWLGAPGSMEARIVPPHGFALETIDFSGVRGKGVITLALLPLRLLRAFWQAWQVVRRVRPDVVVGLGGYISFPGGMMSVLLGKPLVLHEQNSVAGMANKVLAGVADRIFTAFPGVFKARKVQWVGNPLRAAFTRQAGPAERFAGRSGPLRLLVVGGSLGARALNDIVPQALALIPQDQRPVVTHQSGAAQIEQLRANYEAAGVQAELTPFIDDTASGLRRGRRHRLPRRRQHRDRDCRRGRGRGVRAVPGMRWTTTRPPTRSSSCDAGGGWLVQQRDLTPKGWPKCYKIWSAPRLMERALQKAKNMQKINATREVVTACEELAA